MTSIPPFDIQYILILLAPLWINAFDHMVLGRMVWYFLEDKKLLGIEAERMAMCFVGLDVSYAFPPFQKLKLLIN